MNLIDALIEDHQNVKRLFSEVATAKGTSRVALFDELRENLIRHEVAEEEIVRPLTKRSVPDGEKIAEERISEESEAEKLLATMEKEEVGSTEWESHFEALRKAVLEHAEREETTEFPSLRSNVPADELDSRGGTYETAKKMAPTHPHPNTPNTPVANMTLGPLAALIDRARDAVSKARSA